MSNITRNLMRDPVQWCCSDQIRPIRPTVVWGGRPRVNPARVTETKCQPAANVQVITEQGSTSLLTPREVLFLHFYWKLYLLILIAPYYLFSVKLNKKWLWLLLVWLPVIFPVLGQTVTSPHYLVTSLSLSVELTWPDLTRAMTFQLCSGKIFHSHPVKYTMKPF